MMTFLNPLGVLIPKSHFHFLPLLGLGRLRGPGVSLGRIFGGPSIGPFFGGGVIQRAVSTAPPPVESPPTPAMAVCFCPCSLITQTWYETGPPGVFWLPGFYFPQSFLTGVLQNAARKSFTEIDALQWDYVVMPRTRPGHSAALEGCYVHGLFLEGAAWDREGGRLTEQRPKELRPAFPVLWLRPVAKAEDGGTPLYGCPLYNTSERRGQLSTTGHSSNFIMPVRLPCAETPSHWVKRGAALLCQLDD